VKGFRYLAALELNLTGLVSLGRQGDQTAIDKVISIVYKELRRLAASYLRNQPYHHTLQPTALVHEAYLRLVDRSQSEWQDRTHFFYLAATIMRQILVDGALSYTIHGERRWWMTSGCAAHQESRSDASRFTCRVQFAARLR
jgi:hypothetical protein